MSDEMQIIVSIIAWVFVLLMWLEEKSESRYWQKQAKYYQEMWDREHLDDW